MLRQFLLFIVRFILFSLSLLCLFNIAPCIEDAEIIGAMLSLIVSIFTMGLFALTYDIQKHE